MKESLRGRLIVIAAAAIALVVVFVLSLWIFSVWYDAWTAPDERISDANCDIAIVPIVGYILTADGDMSDSTGATTTADDTIALLSRAENDPGIDGVLLRIDSGGGSPIGGEMIMNALKRSSKPTVALIRSQGDSSAYLIATGANHIVASALSDVGSIGITSSYLNQSKKDAQDGITYEQLSSGPFKDMFSPDKPLTDAERALILRDLKIYSNQFIEYVSANRHLSVATVQKLADGSSMPGSLALQNGLIDQIGDEQTALQWFATKLNVDISGVNVCN